MKRILWFFRLWLIMLFKFFAGMLLLVVFLQLVHKGSYSAVFEYSSDDLKYLLKVSVVGALIVSTGVWVFVVSEIKDGLN